MVKGLYLYRAFLVFMTTQIPLQFSFAIHPYIHSASFCCTFSITHQLQTARTAVNTGGTLCSNRPLVHGLGRTHKCNLDIFRYFYITIYIISFNLVNHKFLTKASCRPMFPIVITPAKKIQGNQERMYRKSGEVYLCRKEAHKSNL